MKQPLTLAAATLLVVACSDSPVAPLREAPAPSALASASSDASSTQLDFTDLTNDVRGRLLPSFDDQVAAKAIETSMLELNAHAIAGEIAEAQVASDAVRASLKDGVASALLLDVMNRTMDVVDRGLAAATPASGSTTLAP